MSKNHNIRACEKTGNVDYLLDTWKSCRDLIFQQVMEHPSDLERGDLERSGTSDLERSGILETLWTKDSALPIDRLCKCGLGRKSKDAEYICCQCFNLKKMTRFKREIVDTPFIIEYGRRAGQKIYISKHYIKRPFLRENPALLKKMLDYNSRFPGLKACSPVKAIINKCVIGDQFTIKNIISIMIQKYFGEEGALNFITHLYISFICGSDGYTIYKYPTIGTFNSLLKQDGYFYYENNERIMNESVVKGLVLQLFVILKELRKFNFNHGHPTTESLLFCSEPCIGNFEGILFDFPVSVQICNLMNSSATFNGVHYFSKSLMDDINIENFIFTPEIQTKYVEDSSCLMYKINSIQGTLNSLGFPVYTGSYDFYNFLVSFMLNREFYLGFKKDKLLNKIWTSMWTSEDLEAIEKDISLGVNGLRSRWLKCSIIEDLTELIKKEGN